MAQAVAGTGMRNGAAKPAAPPSRPSVKPAPIRRPASTPLIGDIDPVLLRRWRNPDWWDHVLAWWEGYDPEVLRRLARQAAEESRRAAAGSSRPLSSAGAPVAAATPAGGGVPTPSHMATPDPMESVRALEVTELDRDSRPVWTVERVKGAELLWGPDATGPSDPAWMVDAVRQFGLGPARSALDLTAGLGGAARAIAASYDTWVTGLESSPVLAALAMQRSKASGQSKKAPVTGYDPEHFAQAGSFDLVYGDRLLHKLRDKGFFLDKMSDCVKEKGGVLMFDYVIDGAPENWESWNKWRDAEPCDVSPWSARRFSDELVQRNFDVRVSENLTDLHRRQIVGRIERLTAALTAANPESGMLGAIARELTLWWSRLKVLGRGLNFYRFVAFRA
jgi:SAM-dependent methyltransferase